jgi:hypothetical protein
VSLDFCQRLKAAESRLKVICDDVGGDLKIANPRDITDAKRRMSKLTVVAEDVLSALLVDQQNFQSPDLLPLIDPVRRLQHSAGKLLDGLLAVSESICKTDWKIFLSSECFRQAAR